MLALYQGLVPSMIGIVHPIIYFPLYEKSKLYLKNHWEEPNAETLSAKYVALSTVLTKAVASAITYPHEVMRARMHDVRLYEKDPKL